ncbi:MAG: site-specific tyrosine recombinase XerD [Bacteroidales bacterium]|jgi:integrase/recombinase XerD|nr:site-specific tyrosine recombinase XerD [Bacteroidales bacterium]
MLQNSDLIQEFAQFLQLEKSLSPNSIEAYRHDVNKLAEFIALHDENLSLQNCDANALRSFIYWLNSYGIAGTSQARILSGLRSFYEFLQRENYIERNPTEHIDLPRLTRHIPEVLSIAEIDRMIQSIDYTKTEGQRNRAIIETLYSCGLRVSELVDLRISNLLFEYGYIRVVGKGNKERLIPVNDKAMLEIQGYFEHTRNHQTIQKGSEDIVFVNRRGKKLTRVMIFLIIKQTAAQAGVTKTISPHTFRHSFATHLVDGGANLRAVQDMLGHESITTTEIYTHINKQHLHDTIMKFHPRATSEGKGA